MADDESIRIVMGPEFKRVVAALREMDATLPAKLRRDLRKAVRPLVADAKARVRAIPVHGLKHTGLRRKIAAGVGIRVALGKNAGIRITTAVPSPDMAAIPRGLDSPAGWRHPVFGQTDHWVSQRASVPGWFTQTMQHGAEPIRREIKRTMDEAAEEVARQGGA